MNARRCDRCGVFYTPKTGETYWECDSLHEIGDYSLSQTMGQKNPDGSIKGLTYSRYLDLCGDCQKDFNKKVDKFLNDFVKAK